MENLNFNNLIHIEENLYCLNDIAEKINLQDIKQENVLVVI